jgi:hypothetical protein
MNDKSLSLLHQAVDPDFMAVAFEEFFSREYAGLGLKVNRCEVSRARHKPGKESKITYRLFGHDYENHPYDQWFYANISFKNKKQSEGLNEQPAEWPGCGFWKPASFWPKMNMALFAFPYDLELPYLNRLLDLDFVKQQIEQNLAGFGLPDGWRCQEVACHKIKYRPGKRCVLRYEALMVDAANRQRPVVFYSKTYDKDISRYVYEVLQKICADQVCTSGRLNIPGVIAHIDSANTIWQHAWEGKKLARVGQELGWANLPQSGLMPMIAKMLADLHQIKLMDQPLRPSLSPKIMSEHAHTDVANILQFLPEKQEMLDEIIAKFDATAPSREKSIPPATIHGTFKIAQILCRDTTPASPAEGCDPEGHRSDEASPPAGAVKLGLVDFDSIASGDPLLDVAEFVASLEYLQVSDDIPAAPVQESIKSFLTSYQEQVSWTCDRRRLGWYVAAFLWGKVHASLKSFEAKASANILAAFHLISDWLNVFTIFG